MSRISLDQNRVLRCTPTHRLASRGRRDGGVPRGSAGHRQPLPQHALRPEHPRLEICLRKVLRPYCGMGDRDAAFFKPYKHPPPERQAMSGGLDPTSYPPPRGGGEAGGGDLTVAEHFSSSVLMGLLATYNASFLAGPSHLFCPLLSTHFFAIIFF